MRREIEAVLDAVPEGATATDYERAIIKDNAARKGSQNARMWAWARLKFRYSLNDPESAPARAFRRAMRDPSPSGRGLACALMLARTDCLFRETTVELLSAHLTAPGAIIHPEPVAALVDSKMESAGLSWSAESRKAVSNHVLSSWRELGLVEGTRDRRAVAVHMTYPVLRLGVELARDLGATDRQVLTSVWFQLLGQDRAAVESLLYEAARAGVLGYRAQADVIEIELPEDD